MLRSGINNEEPGSENVKPRNSALSFLYAFRMSMALDLHRIGERAGKNVCKLCSHRRNFCDGQKIRECPNKQRLAKWIARHFICQEVDTSKSNRFIHK